MTYTDHEINKIVGAVLASLGTFHTKSEGSYRQSGGLWWYQWGLGGRLEESSWDQARTAMREIVLSALREEEGQ